MWWVLEVQLTCRKWVFAADRSPISGHVSISKHPSCPYPASCPERVNNFSTNKLFTFRHQVQRKRDKRKQTKHFILLGQLWIARAGSRLLSAPVTCFAKTCRPFAESERKWRNKTNSVQNGLRSSYETVRLNGGARLSPDSVSRGFRDRVVCSPYPRSSLCTTLYVGYVVRCFIALIIRIITD